MIFITHNVQHAYPVGDRFLLLNRGRSMGFFAQEARSSREEVTDMMAGGAEMQDLEEELARIAKTQPVTQAARFALTSNFCHPGKREALVRDP